MKKLTLLGALLLIASVAVVAGLDGRQATAGEFFLDDYKCYRAVGFDFDEEEVFLADQFDEKEATITGVASFCAEVEKESEQESTIVDQVDARDYVCYKIEQEGHFFDFVDVGDNQFGDQELLLGTANQICVRSEKEGNTSGGAAGEEIVPFFKCYRATWTSFEGFAPVRVELEDQYRETSAQVLWPVSFCVPILSGLGNDSGAAGLNSEHVLVCYRMWEPGLEINHAEVNNVFGWQDLIVLWAQTLCLDSDKQNGD